MLVHIISLIVILVTSLGAVFIPAIGALPRLWLFVARHCGSGIILATSLVHLLEPANDALSNEKLEGFWQHFPVAYALCLVAILAVFFLDIFLKRRLVQMGAPHDHGDQLTIEPTFKKDHHLGPYDPVMPAPRSMSSLDGQGHVYPEHELLSPSMSVESDDTISPVLSVTAQVSSLLVLEAGILLHSLFIGIGLAMTSKGAFALAVALTVHQAFEGLGLGARLAAVDWPEDRSWMPRFLGILYAVATPIGIVVGLLASNSYDVDSPAALIVTGISDSLSAGVLLYTGLVELLSNEILNAPDLGTAPLKDIMIAFGSVSAGTIIMSIIAYWV